MKILFVTSSFAGGGITTYAHEFIKCFSNVYDVSVVIGNDDQNPLNKYSVRIYKCDVDNDLSIENAQKLITLINNKIKPDVIVNSNALLLTLISPYLSDSIRIVSVSHSLRYNEADIAGYNSGYIDGIVALSQYNKDYLCTKYRVLNEEKVSVIYNFVHNISGLDKIINRKKNNNPIRIVYSGGTSAAKCPELILRIIKELIKTKDVFEFYFVGVYSPTLKKFQPYKSVSELLPNDSRVKFTGRISHDEAVDLITSANIYLIPSRREGCPMAMLEAMRGGAIIITSDYKNACREMIENGTNGYIIGHKNIKECVHRIRDIILNHNQYQGLYNLSYDNYVKNYSIKEWKQKMTKVLNSDTLLHEHRYEKFSIRKFKKDRRVLNCQLLYNKYHMVVFETLKSAIPLYMEYLKHSFRSNKK